MRFQTTEPGGPEAMGKKHTGEHGKKHGIKGEGCNLVEKIRSEG